MLTIRPAILACALACAAQSLALAGNLNPPPGAVAPTDRKVLSQATTPLPLTISAPGNYVLTSDLVGVSGADGVTIHASDVVIDLNGFSIVGVPGAKNGVIENDIENTGLVLKNGAIHHWPERAVEVTEISGSRFENLVIHDCSDGLIGGADSAVIACTARNNTNIGIWIPHGGSISQCAVTQCGIGIYAQREASVSNCSATTCGFGFLWDDHSTFLACAATGCADGFHGGSNATLTGCTSAENSVGFIGSANNAFSNCAARSNVLSGFVTAGGGSRFLSCSSSDNGVRGFVTDDRANVFDNCLARRNGAAGFSTGGHVTIRGCTADANGLGTTEPGIDCAGEFCVVSGCTITGSGDFGIRILGSSAVCEGNTASENASVGIYLEGNRGRLADNTSASNAGVGFAVSGDHNTIVRNTASINGGSGYTISGTSNALGPVITAATIATSNNPNANIDN